MKKIYASEQKLHITADTHFSHGNILKYCRRTMFMTKEEIDLLDRGERFYVSQDSIGRMNRHMLNAINAQVKKDDILVHCGDYCFSPKGRLYEYYKKFRDAIVCKNVYLVWGNHDEHAEEYDDHPNTVDKISDLFSRVADRMFIKVGSQGFIVDHYAGAIWNKSHRGVIQLYGHSHANAEAKLEKIMPGRRSMDIGVDNAYRLLGDYRPFTFDEVMRYVGNKKGFSSDHHESEE